MIDIYGTVNNMDKIKLPDTDAFSGASCAGMSISELEADPPCLSDCPAVVDCLHYAVNSNIDHYIAGMNYEEKCEWIDKALLSGESKNDITYRRCYQHILFMKNHRLADSKTYLFENEINNENIDYKSLSFDAEVRIQDQSEPRIDDVKDLPKIYQDLGWHDAEESISYRVNEHKYVGSSFVQDPDLLVLGGQESIPVGLPQSYAWTGLLSDMRNIKINNMSLVDGSLHKLSKNFFYHLNNFGVPKKVIILVSKLNNYNYPLEVDSKVGRRIFYNHSINWNNGYGHPEKIMDCSVKNVEFRKDEEHKAILESFSILYNMQAVCKVLGCKFIVLSLQGDVYNIIKECNHIDSLMIFDLQSQLDLNKCSDLCDVDGLKFYEYNSGGTRPGVHDSIHLANLVDRSLDWN